MKKRILSIVLSMVMLMSMVSIAGITTASAETTTTTYTKAQSIAGAGVISAADNILPGANFKAYRIGKATSGATDLPATLTDGAFSTSNKKVLNAGKTADLGGHGYIYVWYRMPHSYDITSVYFAGDGADGANSIAVYVSDEEIAAAQNGTIEPTVEHDGAIGTSLVDKSDGIAAIRFDFDQPIKAKNIVFRLETCTNVSYEAVWISEFGVAGTKSQVQTTTYTTTANLQGAINEVKADNILTAATINGEYKKADGTLSGVYSTNIANPANLIDGTYNVKSTMGAGAHSGIHTYTYVVCDLGKSYDITTLLYASDGSEGTNGLAIYVGNDTLATIHGGTVEPVVTYGAIGKSGSIYTPSPKDERGVRFDFTKPVTGRYVIYRLTTGTNGSNEMSWIGEIAALGTLSPLQTTTYSESAVADNMTAAADNILSKADEYYYREGTNATGNTSDKMVGTLVDGKMDKSDKLVVGASQLNEINKENHAYLYFIYDMETAYNVNSLFFGGDFTDGTNSIAVYVTNDSPANVQAGKVAPLATCDQAVGSNKAGSLATNEKTGAVAIRFDFTKGVTGRYIVFRLQTCPNAVPAKNVTYRQVWISEFAATGAPVTIHTAGGQLRNAVNDKYALRFGFHMATDSIGYADTTHADGNYNRSELGENSKTSYNGESVQVKDFGAVVSIAEGTVADSLTLDNVNNTTCKIVPANNLYAVKDGYITYTAVVINIPESAKDRTLYARPYIVLADDTVVYGNMFATTVTNYLS